MDVLSDSLEGPRVKGNFDIILTPGAPIYAWTRGVAFEDAAKAQLIELASLPFIFKHLAVMPDVHAGKGSTVGTVIATDNVVVPAAVGVDIGCGMAALRTSLRGQDLPKDLSGLRLALEAAIPAGRSHHGGEGDRGAWPTPPEIVNTRWQGELLETYDKVISPQPGSRHHDPESQLGTLGTGNHFLEISLDTQDRVWIVLHSGSRGAGNKIGDFYTRLAQEYAEVWHWPLKNKDLAFLPRHKKVPEFSQYLSAMYWGQKYARINREIMMEIALLVVKRECGGFTQEELINCHHNFMAEERHFGKDVFVTRKGAIQATSGLPGIIPGSMGARSFIVEGKGNRLSFCSASHGAGRAMSRADARRRFTLEDHVKATIGVECRKDLEVLDETPAAYKPIEAVMEAQKDLVGITHELHQVVCMKGTEADRAAARK